MTALKMEDTWKIRKNSHKIKTCAKIELVVD